MRCRITADVDPHKIEGALPAAFHQMVRGCEFGDDPVTVLLFPSDTKHVVQSRHVRHALAKLPSPHQPLVAAGGCFTHDSERELAAAGATTFSLSDFFWTDQRFQSVRTDIGAKVKRPIHGTTEPSPPAYPEGRADAPSGSAEA